MPATAAGAPREDASSEEVARKPRPLRELERLVEQRDRGRDARDPVAGAAEPEQHVGAVDVGEGRRLAQLARLLQHVECLAGQAELLQRPALAGERAQLELGRAERRELLARLAERVDRLAVGVRLAQCLGAGELRFDAGANVRGDPVGQVLLVDAEALREPGKCLGRRARLAALDLAHVLLREALARELRLGEAGGGPQRTDSLAEGGDPMGHGPGGDGRVAHLVVTQAATRPERPPPMG